MTTVLLSPCPGLLIQHNVCSIVLRGVQRHLDMRDPVLPDSPRSHCEDTASLVHEDGDT